VLRRESGLEVQDRIELTVDTAFAAAATVFEKQRCAIEAETLGTIVKTLGGNAVLGKADVELSTLAGEDFSVAIALRKR
jgi:hypothetical protein